MAGRITGVKNVELIDSAEKLTEVKDNIINDSSRWFFASEANWKESSIGSNAVAIYLVNSRGKAGEVLASLDDYVVNFNDGRKTIVFSPDLKKRIELNDFSWAG